MSEDQGFVHLTPEEQEEKKSMAVTIVGNDALIPEKLRDAINNLDPDLAYLDETELKGRYNYTVLDERLRQAFWRSVEETNRTGKKIEVKKMLRGVCTEPTFYNKFLKNPLRIAWMLSPVIRYESQISALLNMGLSRYQEIIQMDITSNKKIPVMKKDEETGEEKMGFTIVNEVDVSKAKLVLDTISKLEDRVKGTPVQKSITVKESKGEGAVEEWDMDKINSELEELRKKAGGEPKVIEAECKEIG